MQIIKLLIIFLIFIVNLSAYGKLYEEKMNTEDKIIVLDGVKKFIKEYYIMPEISAAVEKSLQAKDYENIKYPSDFSGKVTQDLYRLTKDKHLSVTYSRKTMIHKKMESIDEFLKSLPMLICYRNMPLSKSHH